MFALCSILSLPPTLLMKKPGLLTGFEHRQLSMGGGFLVQNVASLLNKGELSFFARTIQKF